MFRPRSSACSAVLLSVLAAALALPACAQKAPAQSPTAAAAHQGKLPPIRIQGKAPKGAKSGSFKVAYGTVRNQHYQEIQKIFKETKLLEDTAKTLNENFVLPHDITITMAECGEPNAFYSSDKKTVALCYELIDDFADKFLAEAQSKQEEEDGGEALAGATMFTLYHELGHAMIDVYSLPVTGKEEDAVDQLATILLVEGGDEGEAAALNGAISFLEESAGDDDDEEAEPAYWDEHSLGDQRFYNIICWTYGKDPDGYADLVDDGTLPEERAGRCEDEYAKMTRSWDTLLAPHMKAD